MLYICRPSLITREREPHQIYIEEIEKFICNIVHIVFFVCMYNHYKNAYRYYPIENYGKFPKRLYSPKISFLFLWGIHAFYRIGLSIS